MGVADREKVIGNLISLRELLKWQKDIQGYGVYISFIDDAIDLLKEQDAWIEQIAGYQQSITGSGMHELTEYEQGKWDGLQIAWNIISEGR